MDPHQLEKLLNDHGAALELFASQWTNTPEDCVQEAFIKLVRQRVPPEKAVAWLYRVVRNEAISTWRKARRRRRHEELAAVERSAWFQPGPEGSVSPREVKRVLDQLESPYREVVVARIWGGLSFEQIAHAVGSSTSSVHRYYQQGLTHIRQALGTSWPNTQHPTVNGTI